MVVYRRHRLVKLLASQAGQSRFHLLDPQAKRQCVADGGPGEDGAVGGDRGLEGLEVVGGLALLHPGSMAPLWYHRKGKARRRCLARK